MAPFSKRNRISVQNQLLPPSATSHTQPVNPPRPLVTRDMTDIHTSSFGFLRFSRARRRCRCCCCARVLRTLPLVSGVSDARIKTRSPASFGSIRNSCSNTHFTSMGHDNVWNSRKGAQTHGRAGEKGELHYISGRGGRTW